jgi:hypothetical protein
MRVRRTPALRSANAVLAIADRPVLKVCPDTTETTVCPASLESPVIAVLLLLLPPN